MSNEIDLFQLKQRPDWIAHWSAVALIESLRLTHEATKEAKEMVVIGSARMAGIAARAVAERIICIASNSGPVAEFVDAQQQLELSLLDNVLDWKRPKVIFIGDEENNTLTDVEADLLLARHVEQMQDMRKRMCITSPGAADMQRFHEAMQASAYEIPREPQAHQTMPGNRILTERRSMRKPPKAQQRMLRTQRRK